MIKVTRIDGGILVINSDLIEFIEEKPETIICLTTGKKIMVRESVEKIIRMIADFEAIVSLSKAEIRNSQLKDNNNLG